MKSTIFDYGMNCEGVAKIGGKIFLIPGALIDEEVDAQILKEKPNYTIATLNKIIVPSANRVKPVCPYFSVCGGCDLQHMNYEEQLRTRMGFQF